MVDESSLASTRQMREFLRRVSPQDKVLLIGDIRQHQGVDAGKPFEQLQQAGMQTAQLDEIVRQRDPQLLKAVEHLSKNETEIGVQMLHRQGRVTEIREPQERIAAIAKAYVAHPENTIIVSPDNPMPQSWSSAILRKRLMLEIGYALAMRSVWQCHGPSMRRLTWSRRGESTPADFRFAQGSAASMM